MKILSRVRDVIEASYPKLPERIEVGDKQWGELEIVITEALYRDGEASGVTVQDLRLWDVPIRIVEHPDYFQAISGKE